eukprot:5946452-Prymnesium_polylepis.1
MSLGWLDIDDGEGGIVDSQRLRATFHGLEVGEWWEEELLLGREGGEEGDLGPAHHEVPGLEAEEQRRVRLLGLVAVLVAQTVIDGAEGGGSIVAQGGHVRLGQPCGLSARMGDK